MKILHVINSLSTGGAEKLIVETLPLLGENKDLEVELLLLNGSETPFYKELASNPAIKIHFLSKGSVYNPLLIFKLIPFVNRYDIIHVHLFPAQYFVVLAKFISFSKAKLIFTEHSTSNRRLQNPKYKWIEQFIYHKYSKIICITEGVRSELKRCLNIPNRKLKVIQNGINIDKIGKEKSYKKTDLGFSQYDKILIKVAGFRREKDQDTVIKCLKKLPENYKLILVGDGERRQEIEQLIRDKQLEKRVFLLGIRNDVISLIKMCDIAVLSSHWEGFGLAAAEAMACGISTVASNVKGLNKVVEDGGLLFEKGDVEDLKEKILSLENPDYYVEISNKGKIKARKYDICNMIDSLYHMYLQV
ncbi:glycosyltransferase [Riemerella anatipestifer]|uniref:glycosyltransferase n=1 Tax=Riemerella anatipestifer TaxID=34085 RepID=UPI002363B2AB|nr:glycosyltransferase [Riemerella anatipestifer]MDD1596977.1 glycosyltransferase [Riemerella anatipestifer]MDY3328942.1 glycosyltransferase [Riemerella anatipestifer]